MRRAARQTNSGGREFLPVSAISLHRNLFHPDPRAILHRVNTEDAVSIVAIDVEADGAGYACILDVLHLLKHGRACDRLACLNQMLYGGNQDHCGIISKGNMTIWIQSNAINPSWVGVVK